MGTTGYLRDGQIVVLAIELLLYLAKVWIRQRRKAGSVVVVVQSLSRVRLFETPWTAARQAPLSSTITQNLLRFMSIESVMLCNHLILCLPLLPSIFPSIRVFSNELALHIRWPKSWSFSFNISPFDEYLGLISYRINWFDLLAVQGTIYYLRLLQCS